MGSTFGSAAFGFGAVVAPALLPGPGGILLGGAFAIAGSVLYRDKRADVAPPNVQLPKGAPGRPLPFVFGTDVPQEVGADFFGNVRTIEQKESTKGSQNVTTGYQVLCDLGCSVCCGPGEILQIWRDGLLVYDGEGGGVQQSLTGILRLYPGTDDQSPDPVEQALFGIENTPAYLNVIRFTIQDHDISDIRRMPIFKCKVTRTPQDLYPLDTLQGTARIGEGAFTRDKTKFITVDDDGRLMVLNMISQTIDVLITVSPPQDRGSEGGATAQDGAYFWTYDPGIFGQTVNRVLPPDYSQVLSRPAPGGSSGFQTIVSAPVFAGATGTAGTFQEIIMSINSNNVYVYTRADFEPLGSGAPISQLDGEAFTGVNLSGITAGTIDKSTGDIWVSWSLNTLDRIYMGRFDVSAQAWTTGQAGETGTISFDLPRSYSFPLIVGTYIPQTEQIAILVSDGTGSASINYFDIETQTLDDVWEPGFSFEPIQTPAAWRTGVDDKGHIWIQRNATSQRIFTKLDLVNQLILQTVDLDNWGVPLPGGGDDHAHVTDLQRNALVVSRKTSNVTYWVYLDRRTGAGTNLAEVTAELIDQTPLDSALDFDGTDVEPIAIRGLTYPDDLGGQISTGSWLQKVYTFHNARLIDSGWKLKGRQRGGVPVFTVEDKHLGAAEAGSSAVKLSRPATNPLALPQRHEIAYRRFGDYQNATQGHPRALDAVASRDATRVGYPGVLTDDEANSGSIQQLDQIYLESQSYETTLPPKFINVEPGDVGEIVDGTDLVQVETIEPTLGANGIVSFKSARLDDSALSRQGVGQPSIIPTPSIKPVAPTTPLVFDVPLLIDSLDATFPIVLVTGEQGTDEVRSATIQRSLDGTSWADYARIDASQIIQSGTLRAGVPEGTIYQFDRVNTLSFVLERGSLASAPSEDAILADEQLNAYLMPSDDGAYQIGQFTNATLQADASYICDTLLRGKKGDENHLVSSPGLRIYFPSVNNLVVKSFPTSEIGTTFLFRAFTDGSSEPGPVVAYTYFGRSKQPYPGTDANGSLVTNNWEVDWMSRSRYSPSWGLNAPPIAETIFEFECDMLDAPKGDPVPDALITTTATPNGSVITTDQTSARRQTMTITEADQIAWFGSVEASINLAIYQLSDTVGRGEPYYVSFP